MAHRYVSGELTHFVGRSQPDDEARYQLLLNVFRGGVLLDPTYADRKASPLFYFDVESPDGVRRENFYPDPKFEVRPHGSIDANEFVAPEMVCFCDIPEDHLAIHTRKYSQFGLAFPKSFLISQGANPVWYVARNPATAMELGGDGEHSEFFAGEFGSSGRADALERVKRRFFELEQRESERLQRLLSNYEAGRDDAGTLRERLVGHTDLVIGVFAHIFGYVKTFDPSLAEADPDNYYMEREWRVIGKVRFSAGDVCRVLVPKAYVARFRTDVAGFNGEVLRL